MMQNNNTKKIKSIQFFSKGIFIFCLLVGFISIPFRSQAQNDKYLKQGDSLFNSGAYVEALLLYEHLLTKGKEFSPQMLLRMAFVEESKNNYPKALYYLNLHYRISPDKQVLRKLEELAQIHQLEGYQYTDKIYFLSLYDSYRWHIISFFGIIILGMAIWLISRVRQERTIVPPLAVGFSFVVILLLLHNFATQRTLGIIQNDYTSFVESPSAASPVLKVVKKGSRYQILDKKDSWYKVTIDNQTGYVRQHNTLIVQ
ncbi:SH3 domain-containing protein [Bernardetia sp. ABR2-2B]|uniref:SH3 domain-containing protein n=1 Tax=Bernardetia sp. ABR2-2B TaxID=3127472 RepID=UPI0030D08E5C